MRNNEEIRKDYLFDSSLNRVTNELLLDIRELLIKLVKSKSELNECLIQDLSVLDKKSKPTNI